MTVVKDHFALFAERMRAEELPEIVVQTFEHYYQQLVQGQTGLIAESELEPLVTLPDAGTFPDQLIKRGEEALDKTVVIKLNGGLGTSMGLERAKSLLKVKEGLSFLDIIARQALQMGVPLVLMNSFNTREDTLKALAEYPELQQQVVPLDFLQHKVPKVRRADLAPAEWRSDPELEWNPPGHGDIYTALITSGMLERLLDSGYEYAFVSNSDNLGAVLDTKILGYFAGESLPFMMEVANRTPADRKGGHLAKRPDGQLILRESAQTPTEDKQAFQDIERHKYFNTNNLWLHLPSLQEVMAERDNILGLPMIRNEKTIDPRDPQSTPVYQLETAMGAAVSVFEGAGAVRVPRHRFAPVKTSNDLLAVRSDAYVLTGDYRVVINPARENGDLVVDLDPSYYKLIDGMETRFPYGPPSLLACQSFAVKGDVRFGRNVVVQGIVRLVNDQDRQVEIAGGTVLASDHHL